MVLGVWDPAEALEDIRVIKERVNEVLQVIRDMSLCGSFARRD